MTRLMGDATHANVAALAAVPGLQLVAGYDSGSPDIDWTPADWERFPGLPQVHIDQAFNTTVNTQAHVVVFDVEPGAYQPSQAGQLIKTNTTPRPTIYVNQSNIVATVQSAATAANWRGDTWVAIPGWQPGMQWPSPVAAAIAMGGRIVAVQNQMDVANAYDLSAVLDPAWPLEDPMPTIPGKWTELISVVPQANGDIVVIGYALNNSPLPTLYSVTWSAASQAWGQLTLIGTFELGG